MASRSWVNKQIAQQKSSWRSSWNSHTGLNSFRERVSPSRTWTCWPSIVHKVNKSNIRVDASWLLVSRRSIHRIAQWMWHDCWSLEGQRTDWLCGCAMVVGDWTIRPTHLIAQWAHTGCWSPKGQYSGYHRGRVMVVGRMNIYTLSNIPIDNNDHDTKTDDGMTWYC